MKERNYVIDKEPISRVTEQDRKYEFKNTVFKTDTILW